MIRMTHTLKSVAASAALLLTLSGPALAAEPPKAPTPAVEANPTGKQTVEGVLEHQGIEGGFYTIGGWALLGDRDFYGSLAGQQLLVQGKVFAGPTVWQVPTLDVTGVYRAVDASVALPGAVQVAGQAVSFDQGPMQQNGKTLIPLRFVAEALGAKVSWDGDTRTATVEMADRTVMFTVGQAEAELNMRGVAYFRRNLIAISGSPVIVGNRMMIPADALTKILGLYQVVQQGSTGLNLAVPAAE